MMDSLAPVSQCGVSAEAQRVTVSQSKSSDITIFTAEGDKVTLSSSVARQMEYATYSAQGENGSASARSASYQSQRSFSFTVEGDLNREELHDIRKALRTIRKAERDVAKGDTEKALERTARLQRLDTIAELDAQIAVTQTVSVQQAAVQQVAAAPAEATADQQAPAADTNAPATQPAAVTSLNNAFTGDVQIFQAIQSSVSRMLEVFFQKPPEAQAQNQAQTQTSAGAA